MSDGGGLRQRYRRWIFTINEAAYVDSFDAGAVARGPDGASVRFMCCQFELAPSTGHRHVQGYIELKKAVGRRTLQALLRAGSCFCEGAKGSSQDNIDYCTREQNPDGTPKRQPGTSAFKWGTPGDASRGRRSDIVQLRDSLNEGKSLYDVAQDLPAALAHSFRFAQWYRGEYLRRSVLSYRVLDVYFVEGPTSTGKSRWVYDRWPRASVFPWTLRNPMWFDGYEQQDVLLIDEVDPGEISVANWLRLLDGYPMQLPVKGSSAVAAWSSVVIVSNTDFENLFVGKTSPGQYQALRARVSYWCVKESLESDMRVEKNIPSRRFPL